MLLREHRGWRQHRNLFALHHRFERGPNRNFGLSESDIAANEPIHRTRLFHVALCRGDGFQLIGCFAIWKRVLEFHLPFCVGPKSMTGLRFALRLHGQHFSRVVEDRSRGVFLCSSPLGVGQ